MDLFKNNFATKLILKKIAADLTAKGVKGIFISLIPDAEGEFTDVRTFPGEYVIISKNEYNNFIQQQKQDNGNEKI